jgi:catechol 2,3-dioxygenase-like lactoylglutathione lyase family enzyme
MPPNIDLVLDCADPEKLAEFWSEALGYKRVGFSDPYFLLRPSDSSFPPLLLQRVPEEKRVKNRMHLDIRTEDVEVLVERLEGLGAKRLSEHAGHGTHWITMSDPEGNEFCVCPGAPI